NTLAVVISKSPGSAENDSSFFTGVNLCGPLFDAMFSGGCCLAFALSRFAGACGKARAIGHGPIASMMTGIISHVISFCHLVRLNLVFSFILFYCTSVGC